MLAMKRRVSTRSPDIGVVDMLVDMAPGAARAQSALARGLEGDLECSGDLVAPSVHAADYVVEGGGRGALPAEARLQRSQRRQVQGSEPPADAASEIVASGQELVQQHAVARSEEHTPQL